MKVLAELLPYFRHYPKKLTLGVVSIFLSAMIGLASPIVVGRAVDAFQELASPRALLNYGALLIVITLFQGGASFAQRMLLVTMSRDIERDLRNDYFAHLERLPQSFYQTYYTGDLMARATNDIQAVRMLCGPAIMYGANTLFTAAGALFFMSRIHGRLTVLALFTMPFVAVVTKVFGARIHDLFQRVQEQFAALSTKVQENLAGVRVVRAYAQEESEQVQFGDINSEYVLRNKRLIRWTAAFHPVLQGLVGLGFIAVLAYGGALVMRSTISVGEFVTFNFFLAKLIWPMIAVGWVINLAQRGSASFGRLLDVLHIEPAIRDRETAVAFEISQGAIAFSGLDFAYNGTRVLQNIAVSIPAGATVGIVGRTGAGKSSLLALVPRMVDPPPGTLLIDGVDVRDIALADLRRAIAFVPQETFLFSSTIRENVAVGRPEAELAEIVEAARIAGLSPDLEELPRGLDTMVGERGVTLSGGQKQRVALARAILRRPRILLLDDCLSAVDTATEERILTNLRSVFRGPTVLVVSHRISAVRAADMILVLEGGEVTERGTHEELVARGELYAALHRRQQLEEELAAV